jgi:valyl-tRNA synthetase
VAALQLALKTFLRLFAPFLPYIAEEVWSWSFAQAEACPSVHRAPWPTAAEFEGLPDVAGGSAAFDAAVGLLEAVHRAKSTAGASVGRHVDRLRVAASPATVARLERAKDDVLAAARVAAHEIEGRDGIEDGVFEVLECALAAVPPPETPAVPPPEA